MFRSMTGFGRGQASGEYGKIACEIRTINHRFCDISVKVPNGMVTFEDQIRMHLQKQLKRGKIYFNISYEHSTEKNTELFIDKKLAETYHKELHSLKKSLHLTGGVPLEQLMVLPGVITFHPKEYSLNKMWPCVKTAMDRALSKLVKDREAEGKRLGSDIVKRVKKMDSILKEIDKRSSVNVGNYKRRLGARVKELSGSSMIDKGRLEQEVALFAKNCDIQEEITRIKSHLVNFNKAMNAAGEIGKKLDFVAQELHREINTVGSKASDFKVSTGVIQAKSEIEKIREQLRNIE